MELCVYGIIGSEGLTAAAIRAQLAGRSEPLTVRIHSDGGDALEGLAINSVLRGYAGKVTVQIDGVAASAASVIAMAGSEIAMADGAMMMLHNPSIECRGDGDALRGYATMLDAMAQSYAAEYARRMGCSTEEARAVMQRTDFSVGTWLTAQEALSLHLATRIGPPVAVRAQARSTTTPEALRRAHARAKGLTMTRDDLLKLLGLEGSPDYETAEGALMAYLASTTDDPEKRKGTLESFKSVFGDDAKPAPAPGADPGEMEAAKAALAETKAALAAAKAEKDAQPDPEKVKEDAAKAEAKYRADVEGWVKEGRIKDAPESRETWLTRHRAGKAAKAVALIDPGTWTTSQRLRGGTVGTPVTLPGQAQPPAPITPARAKAKALMQEARNLDVQREPLVRRAAAEAVEAPAVKTEHPSLKQAKAERGKRGTVG